MYVLWIIVIIVFTFIAWFLLSSAFPAVGAMILEFVDDFVKAINGDNKGED